MRLGQILSGGSLIAAIAVAAPVGAQPNRARARPSASIAPSRTAPIPLRRVPPPPATPRGTRAIAPATGHNPIIPENLPDPDVLRVRGKEAGFYLVGTAGTPANPRSAPLFRIRASKDLRDWKSVGTVFAPGKWPTWAKRDFWAPEIHRVGDKYVCYYTARDTTGRLAIGAAWARNVRGPYTDLGRPLVRDSRTGVIDSTVFHGAGGKPFLVWKLDGNAIGKPTPIYIQALARDGMGVEGPRHTILTNDKAWEGPLVEAPFVVRRGEYYYLFYSGNMYATDRYAVGVARSRSPYGPFEKLDGPILRSNAAWAGPGHGALVHEGGRDYFVYHAWQAGRIGDPNPRMVLMDEVHWKDGWPTINDGTPSGTPPDSTALDAVATPRR